MNIVEMCIIKHENVTPHTHVHESRDKKPDQRSRFRRTLCCRSTATHCNTLQHTATHCNSTLDLPQTSRAPYVVGTVPLFTICSTGLR